jgi:GNAT superfamily N-acetyltransferase
MLRGWAMLIKECSHDDVILLAKMNQQLIEDEKAETDLSFEQLEERMLRFISSEYKAFLLYQGDRIVGYALCNVLKKPVYLRQFFVCRDERRKGYGKQGFFALIDYLRVKELDIDVYSWNKTGVAFWKSLGFETRCFNMRYAK